MPSPSPTANARLTHRTGGETCAAAAGTTSKANTSSAPVICAASATATPSTTRNSTERPRARMPRASRRRDRPTRRATAGTRPRAPRGTPTATAASVSDLPVGDAEKVAEQQRGHAVEKARVETHEEQPAREREGLDRADRPPTPRCSPARSSGERGDERARPRRRMQRSRGSRSAPSHTAPAAPGNPTTESVWPGERLLAQHHEPAHHGRDHRDRGAGPERIDHEVVREHQADSVRTNAHCAE